MKKNIEMRNADRVYRGEAKQSQCVTRSENQHIKINTKTNGFLTKRMQRHVAVSYFIMAFLFVLLALNCSRPQVRRYYLLNYVPPPLHNRAMQNPYAAVIRLREFAIEDAYNRPQIVYRTTPFELGYYNFKSWAVRPARMVTDLFFKHLNSVNLVSAVVRRYDEGGRRPDFEITGFIEAIEEFDSEDLLYAHLALRVNMTRMFDGVNVYSRHFELRRKVYRKETEFVVRELSQIIEYIFSEVIVDLDRVLAIEYGIAPGAAGPEFMAVETPMFFADTTSPLHLIPDPKEPDAVGNDTTGELE